MKRISSVIPKEVDIMGRIYRVVFPYTFATNSTYVGIHDNCERCIKLTDMVEGEKIPIPILHTTFLHEILHGIVSFFTTEETYAVTEEVIDGLASGIYQVIVENNLYRGEIPKQLKVGAYIYNIAYPYKFIDEDDAAMSINNACGKIFISNLGTMDFKLCRLTNAICNAVYCIYCGGRSISELNFNIGEGVYNTIRVNGLDKLFKKYSYKGVIGNASKKVR
uniref:Uncharacterized protein n=1 Tax=viral metagenome TaxID=1070528 RepID=A0A6M3XNZ3_9ZZZZ